MLRINSSLYKPNLLLLLVAALPSLIFYFFIPFAWNYNDSIVYFSTGLSFAVPHYPPLYNAICSAFYLSTNKAPVTVYALILLQHTIYVGGLLYMACIFKSYRSRLVFLIIMAFNCSILMAVNGVYPEGFFAGLELFFWGSFFRMIFTRKWQWQAGLVCGASLISLALTKYIGQLWFSVPAAAGLSLLLVSRFNKHEHESNPGLKMLAVAVTSFVALVIIQQGVYAYLHVSGKSVVGRPGACRIHTMPWSELNAAEKDALLQHYTGWSKDPMLRVAFEADLVTEPWTGTRNFMDSVLKANNISNKSADDYLNEAFRSYLLHLDYNGLRPIADDLCKSFISEPAYTCFGNTTQLIHETNTVLPPEFKTNWRCFFNSDVARKLDAISHSDIYATVSAWSLLDLMALIFLLFIFYVRKLPRRISLCLCIPVIFACLVIVANCIVTVFIQRYVLSSYAEMFMVIALIAGIMAAQNKQQIFAENETD